MKQLITEHLAIWTTAPKGIKKLRELILELAVRGLLVPQDVNDEPASELLKKIAAEKARLVSEGKIKPPKPLAKISEEEKPFDLPMGWEWERLRNFSVLKGGFAFQSTEFTNTGSHQVIRMGNIRPNYLRLNENSVFITPEYADNTQEYKIELNDILLTMTGTKGKRDYLYSLVINSEDIQERSLYLNQRLCIVRSIICNSEFINMVIKSDIILDVIYSKSTGTANQANIGIDALNNWIIPLPPLAEQQRIVAKVDELMQLCDQLEEKQSGSQAMHRQLVSCLLTTLTEATDAQAFQAAWSRIAANFDCLFTTEHSIEQLKQTILQLAVMGKLVPQNPNDEPASELLKKIATEKARLITEGKIKKQNPLPKISEQEKPFALPDSWEWAYLADLMALITDGDHQSPTKSNSGIPFLVIGNLNTGRINFSGCRFVTEEYFNNLDWSKKPLKNDILYTVTGSYGIPITVTTNEPFCVQRHVAIFKVTNSSPQRYLSAILASKYVLNYSTNIATGIAQKTVPIIGLRKMPIPLPPLPEQPRIVAKVDELMALCEQLKTKLSFPKPCNSSLPKPSCNKRLRN